MKHSQLAMTIVVLVWWLLIAAILSFRGVDARLTVLVATVAAANYWMGWRSGERWPK